MKYIPNIPRSEAFKEIDAMHVDIFFHLFLEFSTTQLKCNYSHSFVSFFVNWNSDWTGNILNIIAIGLSFQRNV